MNLIRVFKGEKPIVKREATPEYQYVLALSKWAHSGKQGPEPDYEVFKRESIAKSFGPTPRNSAWSLRNAKEARQDEQVKTIMQQYNSDPTPEDKYRAALSEWMSRGSIGPRPQRRDFDPKLARKSESFGSRLNRWASELMSGV